MTRKQLSAAFVFCSVLLSPVSVAEVTLLEDAVEAGGIELLVDQAGLGMVVASDCADCPKKFPVTAQTAFKLGNQDIALKKARELSHKPGTIVFDIKSRNATTVQWFDIKN